MTASPSLAALNAMSMAEFRARFGSVFEHAPWVAERAAAARPFASAAALRTALLGAVEGSPAETKLVLLRAHPVLGGTEARSGAVTAESAREQASLGLDRLEAEEERRFAELNRAYAARFGFPFIFAVRGARDRSGILAALERRLQQSAEEEQAAAFAEVLRIASFRLDERLSGIDESAPKGFLAHLGLHVLDTQRGRAGAEMGVTLLLLEGAARVRLGSWRTNADGRWVHDPARDGGALPVGLYELEFAAQEYWRRQGVAGFYAEIPLRAHLSEAGGRYHLPLILAPFGYTTYRGS